jgi:DNA-binding MarR family transcriptional regulator
MNTALLDLDRRCNCLAARKAARYLTAAYDRALAPADLRITQFTILHKVARLGPTTIKRLAADIAMDRTTLAANLKPLERDGLLTTAAAEDRRATAIEITVAGHARLEKAKPLWTHAQREFEAGYGVAGAVELRSALGGVLETGLDPWAE